LCFLRLCTSRFPDYQAGYSCAVIGKSSILLDVKPWDDETDMKKLEAAVRAVKKDGLVWGGCEYPEAFYPDLRGHMYALLSAYAILEVIWSASLVRSQSSRICCKSSDAVLSSISAVHAIKSWFANRPRSVFQGQEDAFKC
jgi:hypothetical protein